MRRSMTSAVLFVSAAASSGGVGPTLAAGAAATTAPAVEIASSASPALEAREGAKECQDVPACQTVNSPLLKLPDGVPVLLELACPAGTYFWSWSATVVPHVQVTLRATRIDQASHEIAATFEYYVQSGNGGGQAAVYLGCSATPISAGMLKLRRLVYGWDPHERGSS